MNEINKKNIDYLLINNFNNFIKSNFKLTKNQINFFDKACEICLISHSWQKRQSWEPFITHPIYISELLFKKFWDFELLICWILHDCVEDNENLKIEIIYEIFWYDIWFIIDSVTKNKEKFYNIKKYIFKDKMSKVLFWWLKNIKCILLKIADRDHNLLTLKNLQNEKQIRMAFETQAILEPLKNIINYKNEYNIQNIQKIFKKYLKSNNIIDHIEFKKNLYSKAYIDFDDDTYDLIYKNSYKIIREIEDKKSLDYLIKSKKFDKNIEVLKIKMDIKWIFYCSFRYKSWEIFNLDNIKLKFWSSFWCLT